MYINVLFKSPHSFTYCFLCLKALFSPNFVGFFLCYFFIPLSAPSMWRGVGQLTENWKTLRLTVSLRSHQLPNSSSTGWDIVRPLGNHAYCMLGFSLCKCCTGSNSPSVFKHEMVLTFLAMFHCSKNDSTFLLSHCRHLFLPLTFFLTLFSQISLTFGFR